MNLKQFVLASEQSNAAIKHRALVKASVKKAKVKAGLLNIGGFVIYMLAAITIMAIAQKVWGV